jgi:hypothetical protein
MNLEVLSGTVVRVVRLAGMRRSCRAGAGGGPLRLTVFPDHNAGRDHGAGRKLAELQLRGGVLPGGVLGSDGGLDAVEQALQPTHQLGLGYAELSVRRGGIVRRTAG